MLALPVPSSPIHRFNRVERQRLDLKRQAAEINALLADMEDVANNIMKESGLPRPEIHEDDVDFSTEDAEGIDEDRLFEVVPVGHSVLYKVAEPVPEEMFKSRELVELVDSMLYTMMMYDGIGLAAPQIGQSLQIAVVEQDEVDNTPRSVK